MKHNIKNIAALIAGIMLATLPVKAATINMTIPSAVNITNIISSNSTAVAAITIANPGSTILTVKFFDTPYTNLTYTNAAFTNSYSYVTNYLTTYTNFSGVVSTNTNSAIFTTTRGFTNTGRAYPSLSFSIGASNTFVYYPSTAGYVFGSGVAVTNSTNCSITYEYFPLF